MDLEQYRNLTLTYREQGATEGRLPSGYRHLAVRRRLGTGRELFETLSEYLMRWGMQRGIGLEVSTTSAQVVPDAEVVLRRGPLRIPCRVVYVVEEVDRRGFAYGNTARPSVGRRRAVRHHVRPRFGSRARFGHLLRPSRQRFPEGLGALCRNRAEAHSAAVPADIGPHVIESPSSDAAPVGGGRSRRAVSRTVLDLSRHIAMGPRRFPSWPERARSKLVPRYRRGHGESGALPDSHSVSAPPRTALCRTDAGPATTASLTRSWWHPETGGVRLRRR